MLRGTRKYVQGSGDATECHGCLGIVTNVMKEGDRFNPSSSVAIINYAHCGIAKTKAVLGILFAFKLLKISMKINNLFFFLLCFFIDGQIATGEISLTKHEEKVKDNALDEKKSEEDQGKEREKDKDLERLRYLETRVADLEEANMCSICMERRRNVAFLCGHGACEHCAAPLKTCHMCRKIITKKINLY